MGRTVAVGHAVLAIVLSLPIQARAETPRCMAWERAEPGGDDPRLARRIVFGPHPASLELDRTRCHVIGRRAIHNDRDYLDLSCGGGAERVDLDINRLQDGRLVVNRRPLGEAAFYHPVPCAGQHPIRAN